MFMTINKTDIQHKINELYAPNHCYDLDTLHPTNINTKNLVKDKLGKTKGIICDYCPPGKINYSNLFKVHFLIRINMIMKDIHPNHITGNYIVDLEFIENIDKDTKDFLQNYLPSTWVRKNISNKKLNEDAIQKFISDIKSDKSLGKIFKDVGTYNWI